MKKQVSPILAVILVLLALGGIQAAYWFGLVGTQKAMKKPQAAASEAPGGNPEAVQAPPSGIPGCRVSTLAGAPEPGYQDGVGKAARFDGPAAVAVGVDGSVYVADSRNHVIRRVAPNGAVTTFAGRAEKGFGGFADGPAKQARFSAPAGIALLPGGALLVSDTGNHRLRKIAPDGTVSTFAGAETPRDELGRPSGGYRDGAAGTAQFRFPVGLASDGGAVYVADAGNHRVRRLANGVVSTLATTGAGKLDTPTQVALVGGQLWATDAAEHVAWVGPPGGPLHRQKLACGGKPAMRPSGLAAGGGGTLLLDAGADCLFGSAGEAMQLLVGQLGQPNYVDGPGDQARFSEPAGMAAGPGGVYIADFGNNCLRKVTLGP